LKEEKPATEFAGRGGEALLENEKTSQERKKPVLKPGRFARYRTVFNQFSFHPLTPRLIGRRRSSDDYLRQRSSLLYSEV
jgi:hypothetical protein